MTDKAIFEFNAPETCFDCPLAIMTEQTECVFRCAGDKKFSEIHDISVRDPFCPLKIKKQEEK